MARLTRANPHLPGSINAGGADGKKKLRIFAVASASNFPGLVSAGAVCEPAIDAKLGHYCDRGSSIV